jgi:hypothetical protein
MRPFKVRSFFEMSSDCFCSFATGITCESGQAPTGGQAKQ